MRQRQFGLFCSLKMEKKRARKRWEDEFGTHEFNEEGVWTYVYPGQNISFRESILPKIKSKSKKKPKSFSGLSVAQMSRMEKSRRKALVRLRATIARKKKLIEKRVLEAELREASETSAFF